MKKNKTIFLALFLVMLGFMVIGCAAPEKSGTYTVRYEISGPDTILTGYDYIHYYNETGERDTLTNVQIPWEKTFSVYGRNIPVGCGLTLYSNKNETYTAKIFVNDKLFKSATTSSVNITVFGVIH